MIVFGLAWIRSRFAAERGEVSMRLIVVAVVLVALVSIYPDLPGKFLAWVYNSILDAADSVGEKTGAHPPEPQVTTGKPEKP